MNDLDTPILRDSPDVSAQRGLRPELPAVLHAPDSSDAPRQAAGKRNAGCDSAVSRVTWPGRGAGVRAPEPGETPLSIEEVRFALARGLLDSDDLPVSQVTRPAGTWEAARPRRIPSPLEGLLQ